MNKLVFDTETTGLVDYRQPLTNKKQPHLVQLAAVLLDDNNEIKQKISLIVKPDGYEIPKQASDVHGIDTNTALRCGIKKDLALQMFIAMVAKAGCLIAHNISFDLRLMQCELARSEIHELQVAANHLSDFRKFCTMQGSKNIIKLPPTERMLQAGFDTYKNPNLGEAYKHFTGEKLDGAHDALVDVMATVEVYKQLLKVKKNEAK